LLYLNNKHTKYWSTL